ncbi:MAG: 4-hydroxy-tetrahydrodipicolinate synthase [Candidatus Buchananbacteria bacterium RIFCSPHIGHO2_01_FULL_39_14]|uniref:4-hydroxy-tetrahydrodipicolinate synthase n=2 Tax=Candidatus Buchananiibacteriota TaxID=1817903 RepID=A0A1G1YRW0_9BACT|nr:MAG: 4-hydroxy-tetrahydrodipicolinate synthase [Candidatus Buchananbacteria bacterium RIFCSPHIGHO2_01_FULL_39_14]OGY55083.1 MAG: 4-hydroxy-tetrahydrodipicolinate synthase [Candidatus Buchananbacteria bacterium RIFCSPLOWO2_01_FULL_40_23b]
MKKWQGVFTALVTPFNGKGEIDYHRLEKNLEFQISQGVTGVVPVGTTGESPTLKWPEHIHLIKKVVEVVNGRGLVIAGTGSNSTEEATENSIKAVENGANAVLLVGGYYNKPSSEQLRRYYYELVADAVRQENPEAVVIPYIIPGRTSCQFFPIDLAILAENCPNVVAVKEATGDLNNMAEIRRLLGPEFSILSGDDNLTTPMIASATITGNGVISVMNNLVPKAIVEMVDAFLAGDNKTGQGLDTKLTPLFNLITAKVCVTRTFQGRLYQTEEKFPNPCAIKTMMAGLGIDSGLMRGPLGLVSASTVNLLRHALQQVWGNNPEILEPLEGFYGINIAERLNDEKSWQALAA